MIMTDTQPDNIPNADADSNNILQMHTEAETNTEDIPTLRYQGMTPIPKSCSKRGCAVLSPIEQETTADNNLVQLIQTTIKTSINEIIPIMFGNLKNEMKELMKTMVTDATEDMKKQILSEVKAQLSAQEARCYLKSLSEAEIVESYTRRENIRIIGVASDTGTQESNEETANKVIKIANEIGSSVNKQDISVAHRLPGRGTTKPIIVRFCRRTAKIDILKKKRQLNETEGMKEVKIFEDLTKARLNFLKLMKTDERIASAWSREGNIFFQYRNDNYTNKITGLYEGGHTLGYYYNDVINCFTGVFNQPEAPSGT